MATIITRTGKGSALSITEMDANLNNLNNAMPTAMSYADAVAGTSTTAQSIAPNVLVASNIVQKYAGVNNIPANFTGIAKVGTGLYVGDGTSVVAVGGGAGIMVNLTPSTYTDYATALANSTAIQAAIDSLLFGGTVKLTSPNNAPVYLAGTQVVTWGDTSQASVDIRSSPVCFTVSSNITIEAAPTQIFYKCWTTGDYISVTSQPVFMANKKALTSNRTNIVNTPVLESPRFMSPSLATGLITPWNRTASPWIPGNSGRKSPPSNW